MKRDEARENGKDECMKVGLGYVMRYADQRIMNTSFIQLKYTHTKHTHYTFCIKPAKYRYWCCCCYCYNFHYWIKNGSHGSHITVNDGAFFVAAARWNSLPSHVTAAQPHLSPSSSVILNHISSHFLIPLPDSSFICTVATWWLDIWTL